MTSYVKEVSELTREITALTEAKMQEAIIKNGLLQEKDELMEELDVKLKKVTAEREKVVAELAKVEHEKHSAEVEADELRMSLAALS